jgi:hypothetical protein
MALKKHLEPRPVATSPNSAVLCHRRASRIGQGRLEYSPRATLWAWRLLRSFASSRWSSVSDARTRLDSAFRRQVPDRQRNSLWPRGACRHVRYVRCPSELRRSLTCSRQDVALVCAANGKPKKVTPAGCWPRLR